MLIAMEVRNTLEQFHAGDEEDPFLVDAQMKKLNQAIRKAIYRALFLMQAMALGEPGASDALALLGAGVPSYWEVPDDSDLDEYADLTRFIGGADLLARVVRRGGDLST